MFNKFSRKLQEIIYMQRYKDRNSAPKSRLKYILLGLFVLAIMAVISSSKVQSILELLSAPTLPPLEVVDATGKPLPQYWMPQNWGGTEYKVSADTQKYHHISQGTGTLPMPYAWFTQLEAPDSSLWSMLYKALLGIKNPKFTDNDYLLRFGFIRGVADPEHNPDGLPIGFAKTLYMNVAGFDTQTNSIGFTCAACHTGHFVHGKGEQAKEYIVEGAAAGMDLGLLTDALTATLGQTALSSKLPFFDGRFDRFARKVLGTQYNSQRKATLAESLANVIVAAQKVADIVDVEEGFSRLDALNRIGNQVFSKSVGLHNNYQPINAPVNYPFLWTTSWFKWVQYDGSIMRPLVRNAGEAMGVNAQINMTAPNDEHRFQSSVPMANLFWIEQFLKGEAFNTGLTAPVWPFDKINTDSEAYQQGKQLYKNRCEGCHLPPVNDPEIAQYLQPIIYQGQSTSEKVLDLKIIPQAHIGTDPAQGNVLKNRTIDTAGSSKGNIDQHTKGMGVNRGVCGEDPEQLYKNQLFGETKPVKLIDGILINDGASVNFGLALGAIVQQTIDAWFTANHITDYEMMAKIEGGRPNCLQVGRGYKARPLNGIWATAPFLHNGSVANIKDLICLPQQQRPAYIQLGGLSFDTDKIGIQQPNDFVKKAQHYVNKKQVYTKDGYFILDSHIAGNSNQGHSFDKSYAVNKPHDQQPKGVIGEAFDAQQCTAMLTYLKTL